MASPIIQPPSDRSQEKFDKAHKVDPQDVKADVEKVGKIAEELGKTKGASRQSAVIQRTDISLSVEQSRSKAGVELQKKAIDQNLPFFILLKMVTDPDFDKNPNKEEISALFKKKYNTEKFTSDQKVDLFRKILTSGQPTEKIFKTLELFEGSDFLEAFKSLKDEFTEKFFSLVFENPVYALEVGTKYKDIFEQEKFSEEVVAKVLLKYCTAGIDHSKNPNISACLKFIPKDIDMVLLQYSEKPAENMFKAFELIGASYDILPYDEIKEKYTEQFFSLMFENPTFALELIKKYGEEITKYQFDEETARKQFNFYGSTGIDSSKDRDLAACLEEMWMVLMRFKSFTIYDVLIERLIICDNLPLTFDIVLTKTRDLWNQDHILLDKMMKWDSLSCLKVMHASGFDNTLIRHAHELSSKCLSYLMSKNAIPPNLKETYIKNAVEQGKIDILLALSNNDAKAVAVEFFSNLEPLLKNPAPYQKKIEEELNMILKKLFRMNSIEQVDKIVSAFVSKNQAGAEVFQEIYNKVKKEFLQIAPFISRYTKTTQIKDLSSNYSAKVTGDTLSEEFQYAQNCRDHVDNFTEELRNGNFKKPISKDFSGLPASSTGTRRVAALVERIGEFRSANQAKRGGIGVQFAKSGKDTVLSFKSLRKEIVATPITGRYETASPLVDSVVLFSTDIVPNPTTPGKSYGLKHNNLIVNETTVEKTTFEVNIAPYQRWAHSLCKVEDTWQSLEDCFEDLMAFDLQKPKDNSAASQEAYEKSLEEFYRKVAELVWLIGNTTPLERGSGTVAEWLLGIVHLQHGLEPPVLKTEFPQLDVLDITFPLSDYQDFFTYFFEQSSLPMKTKWEDMSGIAVFNQLEALYKAKKAGKLDSLKVKT